MRPWSIYVGYEPREEEAFAVCLHSIRRRLTGHIPIHGLRLRELKNRGLYYRPTETRGTNGKKQLWDTISDAPMATEFSISRFLVPHLAQRGLALFMDCDMLVRADLNSLFSLCTSQEAFDDYAVWCVHHQYAPTAVAKMDGQMQTIYSRKNWSSVMVFDCDHKANAALTPRMVNTLPGRDLHAFCWLKDEQIGSLEEKWNWLAGHSSKSIVPSIIHMTTGGPWFPEYATVDYADDWRKERDHMLNEAMA